jgi:hypothetical protein
VRARIFSLDEKQVSAKEKKIDAPPIAESDSFVLAISTEMVTDTAFIKLELRDAKGRPPFRQFLLVFCSTVELSETECDRPS